MHRKIRKKTDKAFDKIATYWDNVETIEFKKIPLHDSNLYLIFEKRILSLNGTISSIRIEPLGLILETNEEYIYLSFEEEENTELITKAFVEEFIIIEA